jgi:hypothetical protein
MHDTNVIEQGQQVESGAAQPERLVVTVAQADGKPIAR